MTEYKIGLIDKSGDDGYGVVLKKEAGNWEDLHPGDDDHHISEITAGGNTTKSDGDTICLGPPDENGQEYRALTLKGWKTDSGADGVAYRKLNQSASVDTWKWKNIA
jgi:hypothetical protein